MLTKLVGDFLKVAFIVLALGSYAEWVGATWLK
jgi:hypothetical protein